MGVQLCGRKVRWETDVQPLIKRFEALDADNSGLLTRADLHFMLESARRQRATGLLEMEAEMQGEHTLLDSAASANMTR